MMDYPALKARAIERANLGSGLEHAGHPPSCCEAVLRASGLLDAIRKVLERCSEEEAAVADSSMGEEALLTTGEVRAAVEEALK